LKILATTNLTLGTGSLANLNNVGKINSDNKSGFKDSPTALN
jgi:hypothetical protein